MKKILIMMAMALVCAGQVNAQRERMNPEDMAKARGEMVKQNAERLAKDFDLKDDAKTAFIEKYTQYQEELFGEMRQQGNRGEAQQGERKKTTEMSDEELEKMIKSYFERQEKQIEGMQKRLEVQKKYYAEFSKTLSPKQLIKIFGQQRPQNRQGQGQGQRGGFGGRGGMGGPGGFGGPGF